MSKIQDIKKKEAQHVDVQEENPKESHIAVHKEIQKKDNPSPPEEKDTTKKSEEAFKKKVESSEKNSDFKEIKENEGKKEKLDIKEPKSKLVKKEKNDSVNVIFMGTGPFAGNILEEIFNTRHCPCSVVGVVTQPNKKIGRKKSSIHRTLAPNPVRDIATAHNTKLFQPVKITDEAIIQIKKTKPDIIVVASYGKILPKELLDIPKFGAINIHTSILPQLRGASPVQNALLIGLKETGITIIKMDEGLDTGDILTQEKTPIEDHEKADILLKRLGKIGAKLLLENAEKIINGEIIPTPQDNSKATLCQLIDREDGHIQWTQTTTEIYNRYRALHPWPGIFSYWEETENQMMRIKLRAINPYLEDLTEAEKELQPGAVFIGRDQLCVKTFDSAIIIEAVQPECKAIMPVYDFLNGHESFEGAVLR